MIDVNSSDAEAYKLFYEAVKLDQVVILMSDNANHPIEKYALEKGAYLFLHKPVGMETMRYLWQHVFREKMRISKEKKEKFKEVINHDTPTNYPLRGGNLECNETSQKGIRIEDTSDSDSGDAILFLGKSKMCIEWTTELHEKFKKAVYTLGEGRCFPKEILELMNVPGLTRMQVASHLQKCRLGWQPREERKYRRRGSRASSSNTSSTSMKKTYGLIGLSPKKIRADQNQNQNGEQVPLEVQSSAANDNARNLNVISQNSGESSGKEDVATANGSNQHFDLVPFDLEVDGTEVFVPGINFNTQDINSDEVTPQQVQQAPSMDNVDDDDEFWSTLIEDIVKDL